MNSPWFHNPFLSHIAEQIIFITEYMSSGSISRFLQRARSSGTLLSIKVFFIFVSSFFLGKLSQLFRHGRIGIVKSCPLSLTCIPVTHQLSMPIYPVTQFLSNRTDWSKLDAVCVQFRNAYMQAHNQWGSSQESNQKKIREGERKNKRVSSFVFSSKKFSNVRKNAKGPFTFFNFLDCGGSEFLLVPFPR